MSPAEEVRPSTEGESRSAETVALESWESLFACWRDPHSALQWDCLFTLPPWLKAWWQVFGAGRQAQLCAVRRGTQTIGLVPLVICGETARLMGDDDVCDYGDIVVSPAERSRVLLALLDHFERVGITCLDLGRLLASGATLAALREVLSPGWRIREEADGAIYPLDLPTSWNQFLDQLAGPQRHELRRKMRRLNEAGRVVFRCLEKESEIAVAMETFFALFRKSRRNKARFMTEPMEAFFLRLTENMSDAGLCRLHLLELDDAPGAAALCFDYGGTIYLYNSGYDRTLGSLSVGLICKALSIREGIARGRAAYDFLKGDERYKIRLGGKPLRLRRVRLLRKSAATGGIPGGTP